MGRTLDEVMKSLPAARRREIEARAKDLIAEELTLQDLRKAMGKTQVELARALDVGQDAISRVEKRTDMLLSTLSEYVKGMGGELKITAEFPGRPSVRLTGFAPLVRQETRPRRAAAPARKRRAG